MDHIFAENVAPPTTTYQLPEPGERLSSTQQLAQCLGLLKSSRWQDDPLEPAAQRWLQATGKDEQERLRKLAVEVVRVFKHDEAKDAKVAAEVVCLAPVLDTPELDGILDEFHLGIQHSRLLNIHHIEGLAQLIQGAGVGYLNGGFIEHILDLFKPPLHQDAHQPSSSSSAAAAAAAAAAAGTAAAAAAAAGTAAAAHHQLHQFTLAVSRLLDAIVDMCVLGLDRKALLETFSSYLNDFKHSEDPFLVYQAAYAFQALLYIADSESTWVLATTHVEKHNGVVSNPPHITKTSLDPNKFIETLVDMQKTPQQIAEAAAAAEPVYDGVALDQSDGRRLLDCLQEGHCFERKRDWYSALRGADLLIRDGDLASFKTLVCQAPCRLDPAFQWGLCQRLGDLAASPTWDPTTRRSAVVFLGEIYRNDHVWGQHASIKQWILDILMQLALSLGVASTQCMVHAATAKALLQELESDGDAAKQNFYKVCREKGPIYYPLKESAPETASPSLVERAHDRLDAMVKFGLLKMQRTKEHGGTNVVAVPHQVEAAGIPASDDDETRVSLMEKVKAFLRSDQKVFLLLGDSGSGKTTFGQELEYKLWQACRCEETVDLFPLFIHLPAIHQPEHDLIAKQLRQYQFTDPQIQGIKRDRIFVLICDGYDESQQTHNLYVSNRLNQPGEWKALMLVCCRTESLGTDYRDRFQPSDSKPDLPLIQQAVIAPFSPSQTQSYIEQYVQLYQSHWQEKDYKQAIELIPGLKELVRNPFLLSLSLKVLPRLAEPGQELSSVRVTCLDLYDHFVEQWFEREERRLAEEEEGSSPQAKAAFQKLSGQGFTRQGIEYLKNLAAAIYREQNGRPVVEFSQTHDEGSWKDGFFGQEDDVLLLRNVAPLTRNGDQYSFIHQSLLEYGLARATFEPNDKKPDINSPLVWRNLVNDRALLKFLEERVQQEPVFKDLLLSYIEHSKQDKKWGQAAANAMTILVRAGTQFIGSDFRGIQIPGADLSYGVFDSVQLQDADLTRVDLRGVWMRQTDLDGAQMAGVQFGELPFLAQNMTVQWCAYSPDEKYLAVCFCYPKGDTILYSTSTWQVVRTLTGHKEGVYRVVFSPSSDQIASCSNDNTVRLWDVETGECRQVLTGHTWFIAGIAYSPQGDRLVSVSGDMTVRQWDTANGECLQTLAVENELSCVAYSPHGNQIATGHEDNTIRLWNTESWDYSDVLHGHDEMPWSVAFSPQGGQLASAGWDKTVRLWDLATGACTHVLAGHGNGIQCIAYSPNGHQLASGSLDGTIRLWDVWTGSCRHILTKHRNNVFCVSFSPKGDQLASGSQDRTVQLWDLSAGAPRVASRGHHHTAQVLKVGWSPTTDQFASCSSDGTIRLWDADTGTCREILQHTKSVLCMAFSSQGDKIVSCGFENSIRLWDIPASEASHRTLTEDCHSAQCVALSPQGHQVVSSGLDGAVRLWDVATGACTGTLSGHTDRVYCVAYTPDGGSMIGSGGRDGNIRLWDTKSMTCWLVMEPDSGWIWEIAFSPKLQQLASANGDNTVQIWEVDIGARRLELTGHGDSVYCVAYSPDGDWLASGSQDRTVRLWDAGSGQCRAVIENFGQPVRSISWRRRCTADDDDGGIYCFVTGSQDGSVSMWKVTEIAGDQWSVNLQWTATSGALTLAGASVQDAVGLDQLDRKLLRQRGAVGEPKHFEEEGERQADQDQDQDA